MTVIATVTPVREGHERPLRDHLRALKRPFEGLGTHFARLVVIDIGAPQLLFSSKFDGDPADYLFRFARFDAALEAWRHCQRPEPCTAESLAEYLSHGRDRVDASYTVDMLPTETVAGINSALRLQTALSKLAGRSGGLDAVALSHEFRQLEAIRKLSGR